MNEMELQTTLDPIEMDMGDPEIIYSPVLPNPEGDPTDDLTKVQIQGNIYQIKDPEVHEWARAEEKPTYTKEEVGLGNVDNTSDMNKPVSTATQMALNGKVDNSTLNNYYTKTETDTALGNKVDKVQGKGLSTNDYDDTAKGIVDGVTSALNGKVDKDGDKVLSDNNYSDTDKSIVDGVTTALSDKVDKVEGYGLSSNDYTDTEKALVGTIDNKLDKTETAVNSNGLVIATPVADTAPYIYRQTPVKESFKALMKKIVGASVVWNQIVKNGNFSDDSVWRVQGGTITGIQNNIMSVKFDGTTAQQQVINPFGYTPESTHKYFSTIDVKLNDVNGKIGFLGGKQWSIKDSSATTDWQKLSSVWTGSTYSYYIIRNITPSLELEAQFKNAMCLDLTAMFGTTIADYVYTLETSQSGSGIAWLQSYGFFTEDYYAYKQNKLESGCVSAKKIVGKNLVFETLSGKNLESDGKITNNSQYDLHIAYVRKGITYTGKNCYLWGFFSEMPSVNSYSYNRTRVLSGTQTFVAEISGYFVYRTETGYSTPQVEIGSSSTSYTPYVEPTTYPISPITLRGLFKLSTDKLTVDGDEYNADGSVTRKYGIVDLGTRDWTYRQSDGLIATEIRSIKTTATGTKANILCPLYTTVNRTSLFNADKQIAISTQTVCVNDTSYTDKDTFKQAMSGVYLIYELETPTTEQTTPFTETEIVGSTEEFVDYEVAQNNRDVAIPVGTETDYYQEMKLPSLPTTSGNHNLIYNIATGFGWS